MELRLFLLLLSCGIILPVDSKLWNFEFAPESALTIRNAESEVVNLNITTNESGFNFPLALKFTEEDSDNFLVSNSTINLDNVKSFQNIPVQIRAKFLGRTKLNLRLIESNNENNTVATHTYDIIILRSKRGVLLSSIFTGVIAIFVIMNTFLMGTQLDIEVIKEVVKRPFGPIIGFCCQFCLMPLVSFLCGIRCTTCKT